MKYIMYIGMTVLFCAYGCSNDESYPASTELQRLDVSKPLQSHVEFGGRIHCSLNVALKNGTIVARLEFSHTGDQPIKLARWKVISDGKLEWDAFAILCNNHKVPYSGPYVKRGEPNESDYIMIASGETIRTEVVISDYYQVLGGGKCTYRYESANIDPKTGQVFIITSNEFTL